MIDLTKNNSKTKLEGGSRTGNPAASLSPSSVPPLPRHTFERKEVPPQIDEFEGEQARKRRLEEGGGEKLKAKVTVRQNGKTQGGSDWKSEGGNSGWK